MGQAKRLAPADLNPTPAHVQLLKIWHICSCPIKVLLYTFDFVFSHIVLIFSKVAFITVMFHLRFFFF